MRSIAAVPTKLHDTLPPLLSPRGGSRAADHCTAMAALWFPLTSNQAMDKSALFHTALELECVHGKKESEARRKYLATVVQP